MAEAGVGVVPIKPDFQGFDRAFDAPLKDADRNITGSMGNTFKKVAGLAASAFAGVAVFDFLKGSVGAASDLNETVSKARTIFGPAAADLEKWASTSAKAFGQSKQQALDAAGTFGNLFVQLGIGSGQAAKMSKEMVGLASDFASFHNANPADVIQAQTAAFRGEYDALQRFVPTINGATVDMEALRMTGKKTTKELTAQEKALAVNALMMKGAGDAAGDFGRTSDGLANKQRIFAAQMDDLKTKIGSGLLPVVTTITGFLADHMVPAFEKIGAVGKEVFSILFKGDYTGGAFQEDAPFVVGLFKVRDWLLTIGGAARQVFDILFKGDFTGSGPFAEDAPFVVGLFRVRDGFLEVVGVVRDNLQPVLIGLGVAVGLLVAPWAVLAAAVVFAYQRFEIVQRVVDAVVDFFLATVVPAVRLVASYVIEQFGNLVEWTQRHWAAIQEAVGHVIRVLRTIIETFAGAVAAVWRAWGDDLLNMVGTVWTGIRETIENVLQLIRGVIDLVLSLINGDWGKAWNALKQIVGAIWDQIGNIISTAVGLIRSLIAGGMSLVQEVWRGAWDGIAGAMDAVWERIKGAVGAAVGWVRDQIDRMLGPIDEVIGKLGKIGGGLIGGAVGALTGRAAGGPVTAGHAYQWQENGREVFIPRTDGYVVANHELGGAGSDHLGIAREMAHEFARTLQHDMRAA